MREKDGSISHHLDFGAPAPNWERVRPPIAKVHGPAQISAVNRFARFKGASLLQLGNRILVPALEPRFSIYVGRNVVLALCTGAGVAFHSHKFSNPAEPQRENACGFFIGLVRCSLAMDFRRRRTDLPTP
jgi:hypothetical protein